VEETKNARLLLRVVVIFSFSLLPCSEEDAITTRVPFFVLVFVFVVDVDDEDDDDEKGEIDGTLFLRFFSR
jgi:hypothetical protein